MTGMFGNNLKVGYRLAIGFGLMSMALLVICAVSAWNAIRVKALSERELGAAHADLLLSMTMQSELQRQDIAIRNAGLDSEPGGMQAQSNLAHSAATKADAAVEALLASPRGVEERSLLEELRQLNKAASGISDSALGLALAFQPEEAVRLINEKLLPISVRRSELVSSFESKKRETVEAAMSAIGVMMLQSLRITFAVGLSGLVAAILCAYLVSRSIVNPIQGLLKAANRLAEGDLTVEFYGDGKSEIAALSMALRRMSESLRDVIDTMHRSGQETRSAATEIASGNRDLSERTEQQAAALQETFSRVAELTGAIARNAESANEARILTTQATVVARDGGERFGEIASTMSDIAKSSGRIAEIVGMIDGIAFQTNILSLNAAVEAARAGEHGRGFAVVASEVRELSQRSSTAAREIRELIEVNAKKVDGGSRLVGAATKTMSDIVQSSRKVAEIVAEISAESSSQAASLGGISSSISRIDEMTHQNAALVEQASAAADSLEQQTQTLNDAVDRFRTDLSAP